MDEIYFIENFKDRHVGEKAAVLGGAECLIRELREIPEDYRLIGVNQHAALLPLSYIFFSDLHVADAVRDVDCVKFTHRTKDHGGLVGSCSVAPTFGLTGPLAIWGAGYMGFDEIVVAGFDGYLGSKAHWWDLKRSPQRGKDLTYLRKLRDAFVGDWRRVRFLNEILQREWWR